MSEGNPGDEDTWAVRGVRIGHWSDPVGETGCTVVVLPEQTTASGEVRGGAPATREFDALDPTRLVQYADAVVLTGGSAYGLASADGVMRWCEEHRRGVPTPAGPVPIVPTLALFDLAHGSAQARPGVAEGYAAAQNAKEQVVVGRVGAGAGARWGQWRPPGRPAGLGYAVVRDGEITVMCLVAVNAFGDISEQPAQTPGEVDLSAVQSLPDGFSREHTTIGVVVTNARLDKTACLVVAQGAHDGLARAVTPPHSRFDGDAFVACATGEHPANVDRVRLMAVAATDTAIRSVASTS